MNLTHNSITQPIEEWAADYGIPTDLIELRISAGWTAADAIETEMPLEPTEAKAERRRLKASIKATKPSAERRQTFLTFDDQTLTVRQWADMIGVKSDTIHARIKLGLPIDRVLTPGDFRTAFKGVEPSIYVTYQNETRTLTEWSRITGIKLATLRYRHSRGFSPDRMLDPRLNVRPKTRKAHAHAIYIEAQGERLTLTEWAKRTGIQVTTLRARILIQGMTGAEAVTKPVRPGGRTKASRGGVGRAQDVIAGTGALPAAQIFA